MTERERAEQERLLQQLQRNREHRSGDPAFDDVIADIQAYCKKRPGAENAVVEMRLSKSYIGKSLYAQTPLLALLLLQEPKPHLPPTCHISIEGQKDAWPLTLKTSTRDGGDGVSERWQVYLSGWVRFVSANDLRDGDTLKMRRAADGSGITCILIVRGKHTSPSRASAAASPTSEALTVEDGTETYLTEDNETIREVAMRFNVDANAILALNQEFFPGLSLSAKLKKNTNLWMPPRAGSSDSKTSIKKKPSASAAAAAATAASASPHSSAKANDVHDDDGEEEEEDATSEDEEVDAAAAAAEGSSHCGGGGGGGGGMKMAAAGEAARAHAVAHPVHSIREIFTGLRDGTYPTRAVPRWSPKEAARQVQACVQGGTASLAKQNIKEYNELARILRGCSCAEEIVRFTLEKISTLAEANAREAHPQALLGRLTLDTSRLKGGEHELCAASQLDPSMLEPTNPHETAAYHINAWNHHYAFTDFRAMMKGGAGIVGRGEVGGVALNIRTTPGRGLHYACDQLRTPAGMGTITPYNEWSFGPPAEEGGSLDPRYYVIVAWGEGLTRSHCDRGVQTVLYHTYDGVNRIIGVPSTCGALLQAANEVLLSKKFQDFEASVSLEARALQLLASRGQLQYAESKAGETLLILPRAGHAVLAGEQGKTVYAGEWWYKYPDGRPGARKRPLSRESRDKKKKKKGRTGGGGGGGGGKQPGFEIPAGWQRIPIDDQVAPWVFAISVCGHCFHHCFHFHHITLPSPSKSCTIRAHTKLPAHVRTIITTSDLMGPQLATARMVLLLLA